MSESNQLAVLDLGGSIVAPEVPDAGFLREFASFLENWLTADPSRRAIIIVGGGGPARAWQGALRELVPGAAHESLDWIGVMATRLNAELIRALLGSLAPDPVVCDPTGAIAFGGRVLVAAGWKPGFSTDYDAVILAERFGSDTVLSLSNVARVYDSDPKTNPRARPLERVTWKRYLAMVGREWRPGANVPFDPVASERAAAAGLTVVAAAGRDLENLRAILEGGSFVGTVIEPSG